MRERLLLDLERHLTAGLQADARRAGVTEATARVLLALDPAGGLPMGTVARRLGRDPSTATRFVDRAATRGLVARNPGVDRRRRLAVLTAAGTELRERLLALRSARARALPGHVQAQTGLGEGEVGWFLEVLADALRGAE